ncbi:MAG: SBBP repeat-containing protein [Planctomycetota bacterium]
MCKRLAWCVAFVWMVTAGFFQVSHPAWSTAPFAFPGAMANPGSLPFHGAVRFVENLGQFDATVRFRGQTRGGVVYLREQDMIFSFLVPQAAESQWALIPLRFVDSNACEIIGETRLPQVSNYFIGNEPGRWRTNVPHFESVLYRDLYPGIDLHVRITAERFEYDAIVWPGADLAQVEIQFPLGGQARIAPDGAMLVETAHGEFRQDAPVVYQNRNGVRIAFPARYELRGADRFGFRVDAGWDPLRPLVVDPIVSYATFVGGDATEYGISRGQPNVSLLSNGDCVFSGSTASAAGFDAPSGGPAGYQPSLTGVSSAFVVVFTPAAGLLDGGVRAFTYLGGTNGVAPVSSGAYATAIGDDDSITISGTTSASDFPSVRALQTWSVTSEDLGFLAKLSPDLTTLVYSTYFGGLQTSCMPVKLHEGRVYVAGHTRSGPAEGLPFRVAPGSPLVVDGFTYDLVSPNSTVFKGFFSVLDESPDPTQVALSVHYTTLFGGNQLPPMGSSGLTIVYGMDVSETGDVYVVGSTNLVDFETKPFDAWDTSRAPDILFGEGYIARFHCSATITFELSDNYFCVPHNRRRPSLTWPLPKDWGEGCRD